MKLATSNTEGEVSKISKYAFEMYESDPSNIKGAVKKLSELKGVGPATASLLLSVHDTENALFFGDEVYWWLCCNGKKESIKYNFKEHEDMMEKFAALVERLGKGVSALDVERVGYVMLKESGLESSGTGTGVKEKAVENSKNEVVNVEESERASSSVADKKGKAKKRKSVGNEAAKVEPRRSKRTKV